MSVDDLFHFCYWSLRKIKTFLIPKDEIEMKRNKFDKKAFTLPGTRGYHHFEPLSEKIIACKRTSVETKFSFTFDLLNNVKYNWTTDSFDSFVLQYSWYVGYITKIIRENLKTEISLLHNIKNDL